MIDPAASNSDILVDLAVTVYPIHIDQAFSNCGLQPHLGSQNNILGVQIVETN